MMQPAYRLQAASQYNILCAKGYSGSGNVDKELSKNDLWERIDTIVEHWLGQRRALLAKYGDLANIKSFSAENSLHGASVQEFCQSMIDYLSLVHFEVFEQLSKDSVFDDSVSQKQSSELFDAIQQSTDRMLDFNDKYLAIDDLEALAKDLSSLGEEMAQRFELEDQVIALLDHSRVDSDQTTPPVTAS
jgi:regulator of sigma D